MSNLFLGLFLLLFAAMNLIETKIPVWVLGLTAAVAGITVLFGSGPWWKRTP